MKCFVDSNIWLYSFMDKDESKGKIADAFIEEHEHNIIVSTQVINEVCSNMIKKAGFDEAQIKRIVYDFYNSFQVVEFDDQILIQASDLRERYSFSYWDSLIAASALDAGAAILYSEDIQHGFVMENHLTIQNPFQK